MYLYILLYIHNIFSYIYYIYYTYYTVICYVYYYKQEDPCCYLGKGMGDQTLPVGIAGWPGRCSGRGPLQPASKGIEMCVQVAMPESFEEVRRHSPLLPVARVVRVVAGRLFWLLSCVARHLSNPGIPATLAFPQPVISLVLPCHNSLVHFCSAVFLQIKKWSLS